MAVTFKQLSAWRAGGRPTHNRLRGGLSAHSCFMPGLFGDRNSAILFGGKDGASDAGSCTEEYNGDTNVWATANALPFVTNHANGVGTSDAGIGFGWFRTTMSSNNRAVDDGCTITAQNPHDSSNVTRCVSEISYEWDGTSWSNAAISMEHSDGTREQQGVWSAASGVQNAAIVFGGHKSNSTDEDAAWAQCAKKYDGSVWTHVGGLGLGRAELLGSGTQNAALAMGGGNGTSWMLASQATDRFCGQPNYDNSSNAPVGYEMTDPKPAYSNLNLTATYSCVEEYNGTSWSVGTRLLNPRRSGGAAGTQNDTVIFNGYHAVGKATGNTYRMDNTYLSCQLGTDHWNGLTWTTDAVSITSTYDTQSDGDVYPGGRAGSRGDGQLSSKAISVDGIQTWMWDQQYNSVTGPAAGFFNELMLAGHNWSSNNFHEGNADGNWCGQLTREFAHAKQSAIHFGPKVATEGLSLYFDGGNYKNYFTNEYCKPLDSACPEIEVGRLGSYLCKVGDTVTEEYIDVAEDGGFCGWTVGGPYAVGMKRCYGQASGATNSALYYGGWTSPNQFNNFCTDVWKYDGTSWSDHGSTMLVGNCMGASTGKNENDAIVIKAGMLSRANQATCDVYETADASKDQASLGYQATSPGSGQFTQQLEGLVWTRGGDYPGNVSDRCPQGATGHVNAAMAHDYGSADEENNACSPGYDVGRSYEYDGSVWSTQTDMNACHIYSAMAGNVNSALVIGGGCKSSGRDFPTTSKNAVQEWDGTSWFAKQGVGVTHGADSWAASAARADMAIAWFGCCAYEMDDISWKATCPLTYFYQTNSNSDSWGHLRAGGCATRSCGAKSSNTSAVSALAFDNGTSADNHCNYYSATTDNDGVNEWTKVSFRDLKSKGDRSFHINNFVSASVKPSGSVGESAGDVLQGLFNHKAELNPNIADKNIYIELISGSMSSDHYLSTDSTTVGSIWTHNAPLNTKREFGDAAGTSNSAIFIGGVTGHSTPITATGTTTCCVEEYDGLTWATAMNVTGVDKGHIGTWSGNTYNTGSLGGVSAAGIWQHTATGKNADAVTVHGGACMAHAANNIESPAPVMAAQSLEFQGNVWVNNGTMNNPRVGMAGAGSENSAVLFGGGYHCARTLASMESLACTEEYQGCTYSAGGAMVETVCQGAGVGTQNAALGFGGCCQVGSTYTGYSNISQEYNGTAWSSNASLNNPRWKPAGAGTQNSAIAIGGYCRLNSDASGIQDCTEEYDGSAWANRSALTVTSCDAATGGSSNDAHSFGSGTYSAKYITNTESIRSPKVVVNKASGGVTVGMWVRFPYGDPDGGGNEFANKTYLFANADIDSTTSGTFGDRDGDTMKGRAGLRLLRWNGKLRLEWTNYVGSANEADTSFDSDGNNLITSYWASNDGSLFNTTDWYHVVAMTDFSRSTGTNKMYVNGTPIASTAGVDNKTGGGLYDYEDIIYPNNETAQISIGSWNGQLYSFDVAQIMYYDRILDPVEVYRTYQTFSNRFR